MTSNSDQDIDNGDFKNEYHFKIEDNENDPLLNKQKEKSWNKIETLSHEEQHKIMKEKIDNLEFQVEELSKENNLLKDENFEIKSLSEIGQNVALKAWNRNWFLSFLFAMFPLAFTLLLEEIPANVISFDQVVMDKLPLMVSYFGLISALSGNIGLQVQSQICAWLAHPDICGAEIPRKRRIYRFLVMIRKLTLKGFLLSMSSTILVIFAVFLNSIVLGKLSYYNFRILVVVGLTSMISFNLASINGILIPIVVEGILHLNAPDVAGPLETALTDIIGTGVAVLISKLAISIGWW